MEKFARQLAKSVDQISDPLDCISAILLDTDVSLTIAVINFSGLQPIEKVVNDFNIVSKVGSDTSVAFLGSGV